MARIKQIQASDSANQLVSSRFSGGGSNFSFSGQLTGGNTHATLVNPVLINGTPRVGAAAQTNLRTGTVPLSAAEFPLELAVLSKGLDVLAQGFKRAADIKEEQDKFDEKLLITEIAKDDEISHKRFLINGERNPTPNFLEGYQSFSTTRQKEILDENRETLSARGFQTLEAKLNQNRIELFINAQIINATITSNKTVSDLNRNLAKAAEDVRLSPSTSPTVLGKVQGDFHKAIDEAERTIKISKESADEFRKKIDEDLPKTLAEHFAGNEQTSGQARKIVDDNSLDVAFRDKIERMIGRAGSDFNAKETLRVGSLVEEQIAAAKQTGNILPGVTEEEVRKFLPPIKAEAKLVELDAAVVTGQVRSEIEGRSIKEVITETSKHMIQEGDSETLPTLKQRLVDTNMKLLAKELIDLVETNPFVAALGNPKVKQSNDLIDTITHEDPAVQQKLREQAALNSIGLNMAHQKTMGVLLLSPMSNQSAIGNASRLNQLMEANPRQAAQANLELKNHFQQYYPDAVSQMARLNPTERLSARWQIMESNARNVHTTETMIGAFTMDEKDLFDRTKNVKKIIEEGVGSDPDMVGLMQSIIAANPQDLDFAADMQREVTSVALYIHNRRPNMTEDDAVKTAVEMVISNQLAFGHVDDSVLPISKTIFSSQGSIIPLTQNDVNIIQRGMKRMKDATFTDVNELSDVPFAAVHARNAHDRMLQKRQWLNNDSFWVPNSDATGAILMIHTDTAEIDQRWDRKDGQPFEVLYKDIHGAQIAFENTQGPPPFPSLFPQGAPIIPLLGR